MSKTEVILIKNVVGLGAETDDTPTSNVGGAAGLEAGPACPAVRGAHGLNAFEDAAAAG